MAQFNDGPKPVEVVPFNGRLVVFFDSGAVDVDTGWIASCWLAPIPGPAVLAALARYSEALDDHDVLWDGADFITRNNVTNRFNDAGDALDAAIRAERDGAA